MPMLPVFVTASELEVVRDALSVYHEAVRAELARAGTRESESALRARAATLSTLLDRLALIIVA